MDNDNTVKKVGYDLDILIRARYSLIWLETYEETRAIGLISSIGIDQSKKVMVWSITNGLCHVDGKLAVPETTNPEAALNNIAEGKYRNAAGEEEDTASLVILKDFHKYLDDPIIQRKLRDLNVTLKNTQKTVIILSPVVHIPADLTKEITVMSLPLPTKEELNPVLTKILEDQREDAKASGTTWILEMLAKIDDWKGTNGNLDGLLSAGLGLTLNEFGDVVSRSIIEKNALDIPTIVSEKKQIVRKSGVLEYFDNLADMQDVGGLKVLKNWIAKRKAAFGTKARDYKLRPPKGIFLIGAPGTGKTLIAKTIGKYMNMPVLRVDVAKIFASHVGETEQNIAKVLQTAEAVAPCILFIDEVEKALAGSQSSGQTDSGVTARVMGTLLTWMQEHTSPVFVVATANEPQRLDPAFMRAGRFDQVFFVDLPNRDERDEIFKIHIRKVGRDPSKYNTVSLADKTEGYSGAEIEEVIMSALYDAFDKDTELRDVHLYEALKLTKPLSLKREKEISEMRAWAKTNAVSAHAKEETQVKETIKKPTRALEPKKQ